MNELNIHAFFITAGPVESKIQWSNHKCTSQGHGVSLCQAMDQYALTENVKAKQNNMQMNLP